MKDPVYEVEVTITVKNKVKGTYASAQANASAMLSALVAEGGRIGDIKQSKMDIEKDWRSDEEEE